MNPFSYKNYNLQSTKNIFMSEKLFSFSQKSRKCTHKMSSPCKLSSFRILYLSSTLEFDLQHHKQNYILWLPEWLQHWLYIVFILNAMSRLINQLTSSNPKHQPLRFWKIAILVCFSMPAQCMCKIFLTSNTVQRKKSHI